LPTEDGLLHFTTRSTKLFPEKIRVRARNQNHREYTEAQSVPRVERRTLNGASSHGGKIGKRVARAATSHESEVRFSMLVDGMSNPVIVFDRDGVILFMNRAGARILEPPVETALGKSVTEIFPDRAATYLERHRRVIEQGASLEVEDLVNLAAGEFWFKSVIEPARDANGRIYGVQVFCYDITRRKKAEIALRESEERYRAVVEHQTEAICRYLPDGTVVFANDVFARLFDKDSSRMVGENWQRLIVAPDLPRVTAALACIVSDNPVVTIDSRIWNSKGDVVWMQFVNRGIFDAQGRLREIQSVGRDVSTTKRAELALRDSEERYRLLADNADDFVILVDGRGVSQYVSPSYYRLTGWVAERTQGAKWRSHVHPDDASLLDAHFAQALDGRPTTFEHRLRCHDGSWLWIEMRCKPLIECTEQVEKIVLWCRDMTARRAMEQTLRKSEAVMKSAQAITRLGSYEYELQTRACHWSDEMFRILRRDPRLGPIPPDKFGKVVHPEDRRRVDRAMTATMKHGRRFREEFRFAFPDGVVRHVLCHAEVLLDDKGRMNRMVGTCRDRTERKLAEEAREESERRLSLIFDNVIDGIFVIEVEAGESYVFSSVNDAFIGNTGVAPDQLVGKGVEEWLPPESISQARDNFRTAVATGRKVEWTQTIAYPFGTQIQEIVIMPILDGTGQCTQLIGSVHDVTERRSLAEAALRAAEEEQHRIGRDLHDGLGQELTSISLYSGLLEDELRTNHRPETATAAQLSKSINHVILQISQICRGLQPVPNTPDGLKTGLRRFAEQVSALKGRKCVFRCRGDVRVGDSTSATHLYRIAQEAVHNALRHAKPNSIIIRLSAGNGRIVLQVQDDGKGLASNWMKHAGVGFRTMKFRAESLGGVLEVAAPPEGGTLIRCVVPERQASTLAEHPHRKRKRRSGGPSSLDTTT
jgi:PAS domain S-box-containing protein